MARNLPKHLAQVWRLGHGNSFTFRQRMIISNEPISLLSIPYKTPVYDGTGIANCRNISQTCQCLQPVIKETPRPTVSSYRKKRKPKLPVKEFTIKGKTGDHDLSIKLSKMQSLLEKGKTVEVFIKHDPSKSTQQDNKAYVSGIQKKVEAHLREVATSVKRDYSNQQRTKLTITPPIKPDGGKDPETNRTDDASS